MYRNFLEHEKHNMYSPLDFVTNIVKDFIEQFQHFTNIEIARELKIRGNFQLLSHSQVAKIVGEQKI